MHLGIVFFSDPVTEAYPLEKSETAARFRGKLFFDPSKCTGCNLCAKDCPADALEIVILDRAAKRFVARYNVDRRIYCAQCLRTKIMPTLGIEGRHFIQGK